MLALLCGAPAAGHPPREAPHSISLIQPVMEAPHSISLLSPRAPGRKNGLHPENAHMWDKSIDLLAGLERKTQAPSIVCSQAQGAANAKVAILYAMDIRLPPLEDFCSASQRTRFAIEGDGSCRTRSEHVDALNAASEGSHVFFQTDRSFGPELSNFSNVVATLFTDQVGGIPPGIDPVTIQWWRLKHAWKLLSDYESTCGHKYEFVIKMRTDANLIGTTTLANWYGEHVQPRGYNLDKTAFLMSDRVFATSHDGMRELTNFHGDEYYQGLSGTCSQCGPFLSALVAAQTTSFAVNVPTENLKSPPMCETGCFTTASGTRLCPLYQRERENMQGELDKSAFWKYKKISLAQTRNQQLDPSMAVPYNANYSCIITTMWASHQTLASEPAFVMHALRKGFKVETLSSVEPGLFSTRRQGLMFWRHEQSLKLWKNRLSSGDNDMHDGQQAASEQENALANAEDDARRIEAAYSAVGIDVKTGEDPFDLANRLQDQQHGSAFNLTEDFQEANSSTPGPPEGDAAEDVPTEDVPTEDIPTEDVLAEDDPAEDDPFALSERLYSPKRSKSERLEDSKLRRLERRAARKLQQKM